MDLSGYTAIMKAKSADGTTLFELTTDEDGGIILGSDGTIQLSIDAEFTADYAAGTYSYDLLVTQDEVVVAVMTGSILVIQSVSA